jgi:hypothetical protein
MVTGKVNVFGRGRNSQTRPVVYRLSVSPTGNSPAEFDPLSGEFPKFYFDQIASSNSTAHSSADSELQVLWDFASAYKINYDAIRFELVRF